MLESDSQREGDPTCTVVLIAGKRLELELHDSRDKSRGHVILLNDADVVAVNDLSFVYRSAALEEGSIKFLCYSLGFEAEVETRHYTSGRWPPEE
jgi:hypothetical protein